MTSSQTDICNMALLKITRTTITDINEDSTEATTCKVFFNHLRDALLRSHYWNFAKKRQTLQKLVSTPAFEFTNEFDLPADYMRAVKLFNTAATFKIERSTAGGLVLRTDDNTVDLIYIAKITDTTSFDPLFVEVFATLLAAEISRPITGSEEYKKDLLREVKDKLREAKMRDGQEDTPDDFETETLVGSRISNSAFTAIWDLG